MTSLSQVSFEVMDLEFVFELMSALAPCIMCMFEDVCLRCRSLALHKHVIINIAIYMPFSADAWSPLSSRWVVIASTLGAFQVPGLAWQRTQLFAMPEPLTLHET